MPMRGRREGVTTLDGLGSVDSASTTSTRLNANLVRWAFNDVGHSTGSISSESHLRNAGRSSPLEESRTRSSHHTPEGVRVSELNGLGMDACWETAPAGHVPRPEPLRTPKTPPVAPRIMDGVDESKHSTTMENFLMPMSLPGSPKRGGNILDVGVSGEITTSHMSMSRRLSGQSALEELANMTKEERAKKDKKVKQWMYKRSAMKVGVRNMHVEATAGELAAVVHKLLSWVWFDFCIGLVILGNSIMIGVESAYKTHDKDTPLYARILDYFFLAVYSIELTLRIIAYGCGAFKNVWVRFDALLVGSGWLEVVVNDIIMEYMLTSGESELDQLMLVRMLRLTRLARMVRFFSQFRVLWSLVYGLMHSVNTLVWTFVLILSLLYIFAVLSIDLMPKEDGASPEYREAAAFFNAGLGSAMLTLLQFLSFDSIGNIYTPLILEKPHLAFFFITVVLLVSVCLMNLVIAVMVEMNIEASRADRDIQKFADDERKRKLMPKLRELFTDLDCDGSGDVELDEIINAPLEAKQYLQDMGKGLDLEELFKMLDFDGGGSINIDEFCEGLLKASTSNKPLELLRLVSVNADIMGQLRDAKRLLEACPLSAVVRHVESVEDQVGALDQRLSRIEESIGQIVNMIRSEQSV